MRCAGSEQVCDFCGQVRGDELYLGRLPPGVRAQSTSGKTEDRLHGIYRGSILTDVRIHSCHGLSVSE